MRVLDLLSDDSEKVPYNLPEYPVHASIERLSEYQDMRAISHWHDDFEFNVALSGSVCYTVNGERMEIRAGEGIFINARQLHGNDSIDGDCEYLCVLLHPTVLSPVKYVEDGSILPLMENSSMPCLKLSPGVVWQAGVMEAIRQLYGAFQGEEGLLGLRVQQAAFAAMAPLYEHMPREASLSGAVDRRLTTLRHMVGFIQSHYETKIGLKDIASAGSVSVSGCCAIFRQHMRQTPFEYLTRYRLEKGMEWLEKPGMTVTQAALAVGFSGASFFAETFRRYTGVSPSAYRKKKALEKR